MSDCGKAHGPNWRRWLGHLTGKPGTNGMEIGTFQGDSALWMLENIFTHPTSTYTCIDPFTGSEEHRLGGIDCTDNERITREKLSPFQGRVLIIKDHSHRALLSDHRPHQATGFDFIYVDGDHSARAVLRDSVLAFECLKLGGTLIWDDYEWRVMRDPLDRPRRGIDSFINCYARQLTMLEPMGWQVAIRRTLA